MVVLCDYKECQFNEKGTCIRNLVHINNTVCQDRQEIELSPQAECEV